MRIFSQFWMVAIAGSLLMGLVSCGNPPDPVEGDRAASPSSTASDRVISPSPTAEVAASPSSSPTPSSAQSPTTSQSFTRPASQSTTTAATSQTTTVTIYQIDNQCEDFVPKEILVPTTDPVEAAVKQVLAAWDTADFSLAGYRVTVDPATRTATVDLRVNPSSKRRLTSLSSCEQLALFGSLRKTLTGNRQWNIDDVRFTEKGEEVVL